jgi:glycerol-3-phosphate dehydrogenase
MAEEIRDVLVVGAGVHGAGVAQAAAAAGYDVLLLEKEATAAGTSSRSSKLVHGGLRYLETARFNLVRESLRERNLLLRLAPGIVHPVPFHIPVYRQTSRRPWQVRTGLILYRLLDRSGSGGGFDTVPRREWDGLDGIRTEGLLQVFRYSDARTDDAALTRAVLGSAVELGAEVVCPGTFVRAVRDGKAYRVVYRTSEGETEVACRVVVNAAGPWIRRVVENVRPKSAGLEVEKIQGAHIVAEGRLERGVYYTEAPSDRRAVLIIPWEGRTLVGTTETPFHGDPDRCEPLPEEISYLQDVFRFYFPGREASAVSSFAGIRVLSRGWGLPFHRSREVAFSVDDPKEPRLLTIYGGKLTTYRATAAKVIRTVSRSLPVRTPKADTGELPLTDPDSGPHAPSPPASGGSDPPGSGSGAV